MKKYYLFVGTILVFVSTNSAYATSGACSYHGGVNCSVGADLDGSAICNDGWRNSGVSYASINECSIAPIQNTCSQYLSYDVGATCSTESDYNAVLQNVNNLRQTYTMSNFRSGGDTNTDFSTVGQSQLDSCRAGINLHNSALAVYNECQQNYMNLQANYLKQKMSSARVADIEPVVQAPAIQTQSAPTQKLSSQEIDDYFLSRGATWNSSIKKYVCSDGVPLPYEVESCDTKIPNKNVEKKSEIKLIPKTTKEVSATTTQNESSTTLTMATSNIPVLSDVTSPKIQRTWYSKFWTYITNFFQ